MVAFGTGIGGAWGLTAGVPRSTEFNGAPLIQGDDPEGPLDLFEIRSTDRFVPRRLLGRGSFGALWEAWDCRRGVRVAVRVLDPRGGIAIPVWKRAFRLLTRISHPSILEPQELVNSSEQWLVITQLVSGPDLVSALRVGAGSDRSGPVTGVDFDRVRRSFSQLLAGLDALARYGRVHGNLKPSNVLLDSSGTVRLLDGGLAEEVRAQLAETCANGSFERVFCPAPFYAAPESIVQEVGELQAGVTSAGDLYSVGVLLHEVLTGILPGAGRDRRPSSRRSGIPVDLDVLTADLLQPDPDSRPSLSEARLVLERGTKSDATSRKDGAFGSSSGRLEPDDGGSPVLVGRGRELDRLRGLYEEAVWSDQPGGLEDGAGRLIWIRGQSGMGKTALQEGFAQEIAATFPETWVMMGRCHRQESVPFKVFDPIVEALVGKIEELPADDHEGTALRALITPALRRVFPWVTRSRTNEGRERLPLLSSAAAPDVSPDELRLHAFRDLRVLLARCAEQHPIVVVLDDLQWGDADSAALLAELVRSPMPGFLLIASCRSEDLEQSPFLSALPATVLGLGEDMVLPGLDEASAEQLAREWITEPLCEGSCTSTSTDGPNGSARDRLVHAVVRESMGNPFYLTTLSRAAARREFSPDGLVLSTVIEQQLAELPDLSRQLLALLVVAEMPLDREVCRRALGPVTDDDSGAPDFVTFDGCLRRLELEGLVRVMGPGGREVIDLRHDRLRRPLLETVDEAERRELHGRLATALERAGERAAGTVASHLHQSHDDGRAASYAVEAAEQAFEQLAFDRAARLLELALDLSRQGGVTEAEMAALRARLGDALRLAGRGAEAAGEYLAAVEGGGSRRVLELQRGAAEQLLLSGHVESGVRVLRHVFRTVGLPYPKGRRRLRFWRTGGRRRKLRFEARRQEEVSPALLLRVDACWSAAAGLRPIDPAAASDAQERHLNLALQAGDLPRIVRALLMEVASSAAAGTESNERTQELLEEATRLAERNGDPESLGRAALAATIAATAEGRWAEAVRLGRQTATILVERCSGVAWERRLNQDLVLQGLNGLGAFDEISARLPRLLTEAVKCNDLYAQNNLGMWMARAELIKDRPKEARLRLEAVEQQWPSGRWELPRLQAKLVEIEVALYCQETDCWQQIERRWSAVRSSGMLESQVVRIRLALLRARSALLAARSGGGEVGAWHDRIERELTAIDSEGAPWGSNLADGLRATLAVQQGDRARAKRLYEVVERRARGTEIAVLAGACRLRRGELIGSGLGDRMATEARQEIRELGVVFPERIAALFLGAL